VRNQQAILEIPFRSKEDKTSYEQARHHFDLLRSRKEKSIDCYHCKKMLKFFFYVKKCEGCGQSAQWLWTGELALVVKRPSLFKLTYKIKWLPEKDSESLSDSQNGTDHSSEYAKDSYHEEQVSFSDEE